ncbi:MAG TPA: hypothetical protein PKE47_07365 [Verrucomicrobiota bacterium]|nr:hypothetical protein [Verrucomicrobiota bacterium]
MRSRPATLPGLAFLVLVAGLLIATLSPAFRGGPAVDASRLTTAVELHARELQARGRPVPATVTLEELIEAGHLTRADAQAFQGARVVFHPGVTETMPQQVLCEAHLPDGTILAVFGDGSVQQMTPARQGEVQAASPQ